MNLVFARFKKFKREESNFLASLKEDGFFSRGGARWYTSEHRLQIHLQQPIQEI